MSPWSPGSWRGKPIHQQPKYPDGDILEKTLGRLQGNPPIVFPGEVERLKGYIAEAGQGRRFILQGGDCVERFIDCSEETITKKMKILLQMSVILTYAARSPVLRIGRIAGQYFKPRTREYEGHGEERLPVYRGDGINGIEPNAAAREAAPERMESSYFYAAATLNFIRAMIAGGFADLHNPYNWNLYSIEQTGKWEEYRDIVEHIIDAVTFMESFGGLKNETVGNIEFFTSHEGLVLPYEQAFTREEEASGRFYNLGAHMLWIGDRTRAVDGAHVEYFRGIGNPIGVKIGPSAEAGELVALAEILNPDKDPGKLTFITRLGKDRVQDMLPGLIEAVCGGDVPVTWCCDPMHGNTVSARNGVKTRRFEDILAELTASFQVHRDQGSHLAGVHFELTGEDVTECVGGALNLDEMDLGRNYQTYCDPRLNYSQSMELSFLIARFLKQ